MCSFLRLGIEFPQENNHINLTYGINAHIGHERIGININQTHKNLSVS